MYEQIARAVRDRIVRGELKAGARLKAMRKLADEIEVSFTTVMYAYQALAEEGFLELTPRGAFVLDPRSEIEAKEEKAIMRMIERGLVLALQRGVDLNRLKGSFQTIVESSALARRRSEAP